MKFFSKGVFNLSPWKHIVWLAALTKFSNLSIIDSRDYQFWCKTNLARQVDKLLNLRGWYCYIFQIHCDISSVLKWNYFANNKITLWNHHNNDDPFCERIPMEVWLFLYFPQFSIPLYSTSPILVFPEIFLFTASQHLLSRHLGLLSFSPFREE